MRQRSWAALAIVLVASTTPGSTQGTGGSAPPRTTATMPAAVHPVRSPGRVPASARIAAADPAFLTKYCVTCHSDRARAGGLVLDATAQEHVGTDLEVWEKVVRKLRTGMMPPSGMPRPDAATIGGFAAALEGALDRANPPGHHLETPALQRLNRTEYANAIRDLLLLDVDIKAMLPGDDSVQGFDNIAEALTVSPSLIQAYVGAALKISRRAVGDRTAAPAQVTYSAPGQWVHDQHVEGLPLGTRGGLLARHFFPLDGEYEFSVGGPAAPAGSTIDLTLDGQPMAVDDPRTFRQHVTAGPHAIGVALVDARRGAGVDEAFSDHRTDAAFTMAGGAQTLTILGPLSPGGTGDTPARQRIFVCRPTGPADETLCARRIVRQLARRAYRRPPSAPEIDTLMGFYRQGREEGDFELGLQQALARVLVAPAFLFRTEDVPLSVRPGGTYAISDLALASRLSFFLWSSIPDDPLLDLAVAGRLSDPAVLDRQVRRMLTDPKASALVENFAGQWLFLRELETVQTEAKHFDDNLRQAFKTETSMLFDHIVREDRSLVDLLDADYTFANERLARHYGIPNVFGSYFRQVRLPANSPRRGLLGQGSMLTVTSVATRTSPVSRGKWVLENLLGAPPPQPPSGVEVNLDAPAGDAPTTLRQRLELHRTNPVCASCHKIMDPIGFALENFDLVGTWRETDGPAPVDPTGQLADGTPLKGPADLRRAVLARTDAFLTVATEKLFTYALGRPVSAADMPTVRAIVREAGARDNRFSAFVVSLVKSPSFRMRSKKV
jgi:mono/diheme cytochrome c family protein